MTRLLSRPPVGHHRRGGIRPTAPVAHRTTALAIGCTPATDPSSSSAQRQHLSPSSETKAAHLHPAAGARTSSPLLIPSSASSCRTPKSHIYAHRRTPSPSAVVLTPREPASHFAISPITTISAAAGTGSPRTRVKRQGVPQFTDAVQAALRDVIAKDKDGQEERLLREVLNGRMMGGRGKGIYQRVRMMPRSGSRKTQGDADWMVTLF
ncbi:hypothetical protein FB45DRAFT_26875 [Roridomyces roridus]|uniref:Uncharacterized protein n=1 Tax=Roridomyces roridus TaxID=1738132 RepID=A0AAD7CKB2_9AGAR|nr:hypothetical protein FB45DRAFT_26875 [Roridomyces roridus]